ncbi:ABC transporter permease [Archangium lansingense]|uniref:ABC-2 family transporter protein n=1 Tax=Archangium lansingense TaxID=2995310 RepID=A0ABT4A1M7_9BACT|nr:ABC-2 family transporter protein [Archangium lansinium]MCY1075539.1 ABC-2 family transporter protein [Archangium lansinium]
MSGPASPVALRQDPRSKYLALVFIGAQRTLAYPRTVLLSLLSNTVWLAISYSLWSAVFDGTSQVGGLDWARMRTYLLLAQSANLLLNASSSVHRMLRLIRTGDIAIELLRPYDVLTSQLAFSAGAALVEAVLGTLVAVGLGLTVLDVLPAASPAAAALFLASLLLGFLVRFMVGLITSLLCLWTKNWLGLHWMQAALLSVFSGALVPLDLYPAWLRSLSLALPFQGIIHTPISIYLGELQGSALLQALGLQALWVVALWGLARLLWNPGRKALDIQGG